MCVKDDGAHIHVQCGQFTSHSVQTEFHTHFYLGYKNIKIPKCSSASATFCTKIVNFFSHIRKCPIYQYKKTAFFKQCARSRQNFITLSNLKK